ncbi:PD40 domain-containing protein [Kribbella monticola]|uniref:PD40 domain-containing protein n=1 Tax=Kribbella monticola TaxID=2185285 RepID=UPI000DD3BFCC|nr:PD40 domain-containing protein [Kribbella monticola]
MRLRSMVAALCVIGLAATTAVPADAATPANGNLVFVQFGGLVVVPGGTPAPYSSEIAGDRPKFSPNGRQVAFVRDYSVWTRTLSSGSERLLYTYPADGEHYAIGLAWSPDGHSIVTAYGSQLDRIAVGTGARSPIWTAPAGTGRLTSPAWSPDGSRIAFSTGNTIKLVHPDGTNPRTLTSSPVGVINNYPDWSPDSQKIAFITNRYRGAEHTELVSLPRSGAGEPFRISYQAYPQGIFYIGVAWSPDGKKIAALQFNRNALPDPEDTDERFKVRGYLPDGSHSYSLTGPIAGDDGPEGLDWAPKVS